MCLSEIVEIDPTNPPADVALTRGQKLAAIHADAEPTSPFPAADVEGNPEDPIDDEKIETFLLNIIDRRITKSDDLFLLYKEAGFTITGKHFQDKNSMRVLMRKPRFRDRLKYLINTEWEVTQPNKLSLASMYEEIADDSEMSPQGAIERPSTVWPSSLRQIRKRATARPYPSCSTSLNGQRN